MAAVIRAALMDPERIVLNPRPAIAASRREAEAGAARKPPGAAVQNPPQQGAAGGVSTAPALLNADPAAQWAAAAEQAAGNAAGATLSAPAPFDRDAERKAFLRDLERERDTVLEAARVDGLKQGHDEWDERLAALGRLYQSAHEVLDAGIAGNEDVIVEIAFAAACRIVGEAVARHEGALAAVREVTRTILEREKLVVRVSPDDFGMLDQHRAELLAGDDGAQIELVADERVALGGCLVETTGGTVDARLETQFQRLAETLADARRMQGQAEGGIA